MKNLAFVLLFVMSAQLTVYSQIQSRGKLRSERLRDIDVPIIVLPDIELKKLQKEDKKHAKTRLKSMRFAQPIEVDIDPKFDGVWKTLPNGDKIWSIKIKSPGAYSLGLLFNRFRLPMGAELHIYNQSQNHFRGAFTYKNNKRSGVLPVAPIKGDEVTVEYFEPRDVEFKGELYLYSVAHDYKDVFKYLQKEKRGFGGSGSCNVNINCDKDEMWQILKYSVAKITYNGWLCSGALINNTNQNETPYFLTANHCIDSNFDAENAVFYFNYESPGCENENGPIDQTISGSVVVATPASRTLDFSLLELSQKPPASYKPYYAGWNRDVADPTSVTSIHHPEGDIKKITKSYDGATTNDYGEGYNEYTHWWIDEWDEGTTEGGSSGSPLFDQNGRIVGDLTGGDASCSYNYNDYYQQLHRSWQDFSDSARQLKCWLDPNETKVISLNGFAPYDTIPSNLLFALEDTIVNLSWNDVIDTSRIEFYYIYKNNVKIDSIEEAYYSDTLRPYVDTLFNYFVTAKYILPDTTESEQSNSVYYRMMSKTTLPFSEDFEVKDTIPSGWYEEKSNDTIGWQFKQGGYTGILDTAYEGSLNAYFYDDTGESSKLVLPKFDFLSYSNLKLSFYLLMQEFNGDIHRLNILYKSADSCDWNILRTYDTYLDNWEKRIVSLPNLTNNYLIAFEAIGLGGLGIAIDSILIIEDGKYIDVDFTSDKDTICIYDSVQFLTSIDASNDFYWDFGETAEPKTAVGAGPHKVKYNSPGIKSTRLKVNEAYVKTNYEAVIVFDEPETPVFVNSGDWLISGSEVGNQWYYNNEMIDGATEVRYLITEDGYYSVEVTNSFGCSSVSENKHMVVSDLETPEEFEDTDKAFDVFPNPNSGTFTIKFNKQELDEQLSYEIIDISGKIIQADFINSNDSLDKITILNLVDGMYFLKVYSGTNHFVSKLLIKK